VSPSEIDSHASTFISSTVKEKEALDLCPLHAQKQLHSCEWRDLRRPLLFFGFLLGLCDRW